MVDHGHHVYCKLFGLNVCSFAMNITSLRQFIHYTSDYDLGVRINNIKIMFLYFLIFFKILTYWFFIVFLSLFYVYLIFFELRKL